MRGIERTKERSTTPDTGPLASYRHDGFWCELYGCESSPSPHAAQVCARLAGMDMAELRRRAQAAEHELFNLGITFVRDEHGVFKVLEDNARTPSGVSYVIENRYLMLRAFPRQPRHRPAAHGDLRQHRPRLAVRPAL